MPLPMMRPGHVHCYLLPVEDGYLLVDTGLGLPDAPEFWRAELAALDRPVTTIFITHFHPDHLGASQDVVALTGARVVQGRLDAEQAERVWPDANWSSVVARWFNVNGVPKEVTAELVGQGLLVRPFIRPVADPDLVDADDVLE